MIREAIGDGISYGLTAALVLMMCFSGAHLGYRVVEFAIVKVAEK